MYCVYIIYCENLTYVGMTNDFLIDGYNIIRLNQVVLNTLRKKIIGYLYVL